ncbi:MAG: BTAD domain-containing putative transcriptional regulator [Trueperaceae bacterium]
MIVLHAKLVIPSFTAARHPRPQLVEAAHAHLLRGAALLVAPPGYGKTVLLAELVERSGAPSVWLQLDESDNDPAAFVAALAEGTRRAFPAMGARLAEALNASPSSDANRHLTMLVNAFVDAPQGEWTLVLDDLHLVSNPEVVRLVERLVDMPAPGMRVVMASRSMPSLPIARWRARGVLGVIGADELRFTPDDAGAWLRRGLPGLSDAAVDRLVARTEGWAVGLQLAAQLLRGEDDAAVEELVDRLEGDHPVVADYLMDEAFARQPAEVQRFLLDTSILPQFDAASCAALLEPDGVDDTAAEAMLARLEHGLAFLQRLDDRRRWYRYHQLFREFLRSRAERVDPGRTKLLRRRAARAAEQRGEVDAAVTFALANDDLDDTARLLRIHGARLLRAGRAEALHRWLVPLAPVVRACPDLLLLHGRVLHQRGRLAEAVAALHEARDAAVRLSMSDIACASGTEMAAIVRSQGDYQRARTWSEEATATAARDDVLPATRATAWMERAKIEGALHGMEDARRLAERALAELDGGSHGAAVDADSAAHLHAALSCSLGQICWWHGDADAAVRHLRTALARLGGADTPQAADVRLALATPTLYRYHHGVALEHASRALETFQRYELRERLPAAYAALGNALTRAGDFERAEACLRQAMAIADEIGGASYDHVMAAGYLSHLLELQGRSAEATQVAEEALWAHEGAPTSYEAFVCRSVLADTYLSAGRADDAERIYRQLVDLGEAQQYRVPLALAYFGLAYLRLTRGEHDRGSKYAERSWEMLSPTNAWQLYADQGERARVVCAALREAHPEDAFLARVEAALGAPATHASARPEPITVDVLGEMRVTIAGQEISAAAWVSAKAHDLLAYLITLRTESIRVDQALDALWPDEPERAKTAFHTALYRLRGALRQGQDDDTKFVLVEGRKYRLDVARFAFDVDRFDTLLAQARRSEAGRAMAALAEADALVRGEYLAGLDYPWAMGERRRIADAHLEALATLAELQLRHGRPGDAVLTARRFATLDPYSERACVLEMRALADRGDLAALERSYRAFAERLERELAVRPSPDTLRAYDTLRAPGGAR